MTLRRRMIATALGVAATLAVGGATVGAAASRSQHAQPPPPTLPAPYSAYGQYAALGKRVFFARLTGFEEIGPNGTREAGNPYGLGGATLLVKGQLVCTSIVMVEAGFATAAHIHRGVAGVNGPVVLPLATPVATSAISSHSSGCVRADPVLLEEIRTKPGRFYVNVHTNELPNGALRGQLTSLPVKKATTAKKKVVKKKVAKKKPKPKKK